MHISGLQSRITLTKEGNEIANGQTTASCQFLQKLRTIRKFQSLPRDSATVKQQRPVVVHGVRKQFGPVGEEIYVHTMG